MARINGPLQPFLWKLRVLCEILSVNNEFQTWNLRANFDGRSDKFNTQTLPNMSINEIFTKLKWNTSNGSPVWVFIIRNICCMKVHFLSLLETARLFRFHLHRSRFLSSPLLSSSGVLILVSPRHPYETYKQTPYSLSDIAPPSLSAHYILWTVIPYYTVFQFAAILDIPPQIAVNKQWRYIGVWLTFF